MCNVTQKRIKNIAVAHKIPCAYCGEEVTKETVTIDHIKAKFRGGENKIDNYFISCKSCNSRKSSSELKKYIKKIDICNIINNIIIMNKHIPKREYYYKLFSNEAIPEELKKIMEEAI